MWRNLLKTGQSARVKADTPQPRRVLEPTLDGRWRAVYRWCMARTNIDIDETACRAVMERYGLATKREAVNFALRTLAAEPLSVGEARRMRGSGWEGDLDDMRQSRPR